MLVEFNKTFNLPKDTPFKKAELENALIETFGSIQYFKCGGFMANGQSYPTTYNVGTKFEWEYNVISYDGDAKSCEEALMGLFINYGNGYDYQREFKEIVKNVYGQY